MDDRLCGLIAIAAVALSGCGGVGAADREGPDAAALSSAASRQRATSVTDKALPLMTPFVPQSIERDTPPAVRARIIREQQRFLKAAKQASGLPATAAAGCQPSGISGATLGPPPPEISARNLGHHVEVVFGYRTLPRSPACRPAVLNVVVYSGEKASSSFNNAGGVAHYSSCLRRRSSLGERASSQAGLPGRVSSSPRSRSFLPPRSPPCCSPRGCSP
jgi:hypothetical protein